MLKTYSEFWYRFKKDKLAVAGSIIVIGLFMLSFLAPLIAPYDPTAIDAHHVLTPPGTEHWFGTDDLGRRKDVSQGLTKVLVVLNDEYPEVGHLKRSLRDS